MEPEPKQAGEILITPPHDTVTGISVIMWNEGHSKEETDQAAFLTYGSML